MPHLLEQFYHLGQRALTRVDLTSAIPAVYRRLDAVARYLEYGQVCLAIHAQDNQLLISSNKFQYGFEEKSNKAALVENGLYNLQKIADGDLPSSYIYDRVFAPYGMPPLKNDSTANVKKLYRAVNNWIATLDKDVQEQMITAFQELSKPLEQASYSEAASFFLTHMTDDSIENVSTKFHKLLQHSRNNLKIIHERALQDEMKIMQVLTTNELIQLQTLLLPPDNVILIFPNRPATEGKDHHAEMNLMEYLIDLEIIDKEETYLAVSKLSCYGCLLDLSYLSETYDITVRGTHMVKYSSRMNSKWFTATEELHKFYTPLAIDDENTSFLFAENSDSDDELVPAGDITSSFDIIE